MIVKRETVLDHFKKVAGSVAGTYQDAVTMRAASPIGER